MIKSDLTNGWSFRPGHRLFGEFFSYQGADVDCESLLQSLKLPFWKTLGEIGFGSTKMCIKNPTQLLNTAKTFVPGTGIVIEFRRNKRLTKRLSNELNLLKFKAFFMKTNKIASFAAGLAIAFTLFAFTTFKNGSIKGTVSPSAAATSAYVVSGMDTLRTNIRNGAFEIGEVKPGTYKLVIEAIAPYKNFEKEGVVVNEKKATDVGEITLQQ